MTDYRTIEVIMPQHVLIKLLADAAELGSIAALTKVGALKPFISKTEAYNIYGRRTIDRWLREKKVKQIKMSPNAVKRYLSRLDLEVLYKSLAPSYALIVAK